MSVVTAAVGRRPKIFFGWYIVAAAALINVYGAGVWFYGFPIFYNKLLETFGWSAAGGAAIISLSRLEGGLEGPIIGWLVDRFGPRRLAVIGAVIFGLGYLAMSRISEDGYDVVGFHVTPFVAFVILYAGWMSVGYNTGFGHASMAAVNAWFVRKRSRAFTVFSLGAGGSGLTVVFLGWLLANYGWRTAAFVAGIGIFVIVIPISLLLRHKPEQYGYLPDGDTLDAHGAIVVDGGGAPSSPLAAAQAHEPRQAPAAGTQWPMHDFSVKEALVTFSFWMLILGTGARAIAMTSVVIHQVKYLTDVRGISDFQASAALGAVVTISLLGRLSFGWLGDYVPKRYILISTTLFQALGIFILANATTMTLVWVYVVVYGIAYGGAIPVYMAIVGEYFGRQNFATIRGFMQMFQIPATVVGPIYAGWIFDRTGDYKIAFTTFIVALLVGVGFLFAARRPPPPVYARPREGAVLPRV